MGPETGLKPQAAGRAAPILASMTPEVLLIALAMHAAPAAGRSAGDGVRQASLRATETGPVRRVDAEAGPLRDGLEIVEPVVGDTGPLATNLRQPTHDFRLPTGFQRVYRVPGEKGMLMRGNGALFAVFPESVYAPTARGALPVTPPGTVYRFGMPGALHFAPSASGAATESQQRFGAGDGASARSRIDLHRDLHCDLHRDVHVEGRVDGRVDGRIGAGDPPAHADAANESPRDDAQARAGAPQSSSLGARELTGATPGGDPSPAAATAADIDGAAASAASSVYAHLGFGPARIDRR